MVAQRWGELTAQCRATGTTLPVSDGLVAANASVHRLTALTRNNKSFAATGISIVNPWER